MKVLPIVLGAATSIAMIGSMAPPASAMAHCPAGTRWVQFVPGRPGAGRCLHRHPYRPQPRYGWGALNSQRPHHHYPQPRYGWSAVHYHHSRPYRPQPIYGW